VQLVWGLGLGLGLGEPPAEEGEGQQQQQQVPTVAVSVGCNLTPQGPYLCWPYLTLWLHRLSRLATLGTVSHNHTITPPLV
jgi:hypothetical protein